MTSDVVGSPSTSPLSHPSERKMVTSIHAIPRFGARRRQRQGVLVALLENLIGELSVGQGAGELSQRPDHHGEDAERLHACRLGIVGCQAGGDVVDDCQHAVGVGPFGCLRAAPDLVEQGGGRQPLSGLSRC